MTGPARHAVGIAGGKGGVGKSTIALNLALCLLRLLALLRGEGVRILGGIENMSAPNGPQARHFRAAARRVAELVGKNGAAD